VRRIVRTTRSDAALLVTTAVATVAFDLVTAVAVAVGVALATLLALKAVADNTTFAPEAVEPTVDVDATLERARCWTSTSSPTASTAPSSSVPLSASCSS
jgi:SulP family sulfate permease